MSWQRATEVLVGGNSYESRLGRRAETEAEVKVGRKLGPGRSEG